MRTVKQIIELWPSAEILADDLSLKYRSYARVMKVRGRIPEKHWETMAARASSRGIALSVSDIAAAHSTATQEQER